MVLRVLENELNRVLDDIDKLNFVELIRNCRLALGLMQCKVAEFIGSTANRIKNLECGFFTEMPNEYEIVGLSRLYDIKYSILEEKALEYIKQRNKTHRKPQISKYMHPVRANP